MRRTLTALVLAAAAALTLAGCASGESTVGAGPTHAVAVSPSPTVTSAADCTGVFVIVQFGLLGAHDVNACAPASAPITAAAALKAVGVTTEGTQQYGDQVVCRVNGEPSASKPIDVPGQPPYTEKCAGMPAAFAYWAVWVRDSAAGQWDYAQSGITTEQLKPGQTLGVKFTTGSDTTPPQG